MTWAQIRLGQRLDEVANAGVSGQRSDEMLARFVTDVINLKPNIVHVLAGTNDVGQGKTAAQIQLNLTAIMEKAERAGIVCVMGTIPPNSNYTAGQKTIIDTVNTWLKNIPTSTRPGLVVVDYFSVLTDGSGNYLAGYSTDGTHPIAVGAAAMGKLLATTLKPFVPVRSLLGPDENIYTLLNLNPLATGTTGDFNHGASGVLSTSWNLRASSGSTSVAVSSKVVRTDGVVGEWDRIIPDTVSGGVGARRRQGPTSGFAVGQKIRLIQEFREDTPVGVTRHSLSLQCASADLLTTYAQTYDCFLGPGNPYPTTDPIRYGVMATPEITIPASTARIEIFSDRNGTSGIEYGRTFARITG